MKKDVEYSQLGKELEEKGETITQLTANLEEMQNVLRNTQTELTNLKFQAKPFISFLKGNTEKFVENAVVEDRVLTLENDLAKANSVNAANSLVIDNLLVHFLQKYLMNRRSVRN